MTTPRTLGPYRILERIGVGGAAEVFRARRFGASGFAKDVALKVLTGAHADDADAQRRLIAEAKLGAAMSHRNLVAVLDLGVHEGRYYVAMECVRGGDLATVARRGPPGEALALAIVQEVTLALGYIHAFADPSGRPLGLVHRDISPGNVLVSRTGQVKLADLGIVKATELASQTRAGVLQGKYAYLSPEQLAGEPVSARTDQFALGVMLAELVTGRRPFDAPTPVATMDRIRSGAPPELEGLAEDVRRVVVRCVAFDPGERFADMREVFGALEGLRRGRAAVGAWEIGAWVREIGHGHGHGHGHGNGHGNGHGHGGG